MSERGYLPAAFGRRSRFGTPAVGILLSSVGIFTMLTFSFLEIVEMLNVVYSMGELLEFAAFVWLRVSQPELKRPFKYAPLPHRNFTVRIVQRSVDRLRRANTSHAPPASTDAGVLLCCMNQ